MMKTCVMASHVRHSERVSVISDCLVSLCNFGVPLTRGLELTIIMIASSRIDCHDNGEREIRMTLSAAVSLFAGSQQDGHGCQPAADTGREIAQGIQCEGAD